MQGVRGDFWPTNRRIIHKPQFLNEPYFSTMQSELEYRAVNNLTDVTHELQWRKKNKTHSSVEIRQPSFTNSYTKVLICRITTNKSLDYIYILYKALVDLSQSGLRLRTKWRERISLTKLLYEQFSNSKFLHSPKYYFNKS